MIHERLVAEHGFDGSHQRVKLYVAEARPRIAAHLALVTPLSGLHRRFEVTPGARTRALVEVLLLHGHLPAAAVLAGLRAALDLGAVSPDAVAVEARRATTTLPTTAATSGSGARVLTLPTRPPATRVLPTDDRPEPSVAHYDQLLSRPSPPPAASAAPEGEAVS